MPRGALRPGLTPPQQDVPRWPGTCIAATCWRCLKLHPVLRYSVEGYSQSALQPTEPLSLPDAETSRSRVGPARCHTELRSWPSGASPRCLRWPGPPQLLTALPGLPQPPQSGMVGQDAHGSRRWRWRQLCLPGVSLEPAPKGLRSSQTPLRLSGSPPSPFVLKSCVSCLFSDFAEECWGVPPLRAHVTCEFGSPAGAQGGCPGVRRHGGQRACVWGWGPGQAPAFGPTSRCCPLPGHGVPTVPWRSQVQGGDLDVGDS